MKFWKKQAKEDNLSVYEEETNIDEFVTEPPKEVDVDMTGFEAVEEDENKSVEDNSWGTNEIDVAFEGVGDMYIRNENLIKTVDDCTEVDVIDEEWDITEAEDAYKMAEVAKSAKPAIEATAEIAVGEAIKFQHEKMKFDMQEALQDEVSYRLGKYEKKRRNRRIKNLLGVLVKVIIITAIVVVIWNNDAIRDKIILLVTDFVEIVKDLWSDGDASSNKFFQDLVK